MEKVRRTKQKQLLLDILRSQAPMTAAQLYSRAAAQCPSIAKSTVYRNLESMVRHGELNHGFLENGESFFSLAGAEHHHYMICRDCNRMQALPTCPIEALERMTADSDFVATDHVVQIYGYCKSCAAKHGI